MKSLPDFTFERQFWRQGNLVIGLDEVGRGALAGPVTVGAVCLCLPTDEGSMWQKLGINDSKQLLPRKREKLSKIIREQAWGFATASSDVKIINTQGIVKAVQIAMRQAVKTLISKLKTQLPAAALVDAFTIRHLPTIPLTRQKGIIRGDSLSLSIAAASILAKVERDTLMTQLHGRYRFYGWSENKGYGTIIHRTALQKHGPSDLHRTLFIRNIALTS